MAFQTYQSTQPGASFYAIQSPVTTYSESNDFFV